MTVRRIAIAMLTSLLVMSGAHPAAACSCAGGDPRDRLEAADAAIVARLKEKTVDPDGQRAVYRFKVAEWVKGDGGTFVDVHSAAYGAACGIEAKIGQRIGLFLYLDPDEEVWTSGLCSQISPRKLRAAARPLPDPDGEGPVRYVVGGNLGPNRLIALDARGRTLAYGEGEGHTQAIDACPGGGRLVETASVDGSGVVVVRRTGSLDVLRRVLVVRTTWPHLYDVTCLRRLGGRVLVAEEHGREWWIHLLRWGRDRVVWHGDAANAYLVGGKAFVVKGGALWRLSLDGGGLSRIMSLPGGDQRVEPSPTGRYWAYVRYGGAVPSEPPSEIRVFDRRDGSLDRYALQGSNDWGEVAWIDDGRLVYAPGPGDDDTLFVLEVPGLRRVARVDGWSSSDVEVEGYEIVGLGWGVLRRTTVGVPGSEVIRRFEGPETYALEVLGG
jgi:hypothetical protein